MSKVEIITRIDGRYLSGRTKDQLIDLVFLLLGSAISQEAVETICREGGLIVLGPLDAETMRWIKPPEDAVVDVRLAQTVGLRCTVCITKAGSDRARKALGIEGNL